MQMIEKAQGGYAKERQRRQDAKEGNKTKTDLIRMDQIRTGEKPWLESDQSEFSTVLMPLLFLALICG